MEFNWQRVGKIEFLKTQIALLKWEEKLKDEEEIYHGAGEVNRKWQRLVQIQKKQESPRLMSEVRVENRECETGEKKEEI